MEPRRKPKYGEVFKDHDGEIVMTLGLLVDDYPVTLTIVEPPGKPYVEFGVVSSRNVDDWKPMRGTIRLPR